MAELHTPDLVNIEAIAQNDVRFYAAIGAAVSLAAALELQYFDLFSTAIGLPENKAARIFYFIKTAGQRRILAERAIEGTLDENGDKVWKSLLQRITAATGDSGSRNFLSHNPVRSIVKQEDGLFAPGVFEEALFEGGALTTEYLVEQDHIQILAGEKRERSINTTQALTYCHEVQKLITDISSFLQRYKGGDFVRD